MLSLLIDQKLSLFGIRRYHLNISNIQAIFGNVFFFFFYFKLLKEVELPSFDVNQKVAAPQQPRPALNFGGNNDQSQHFAKPLSPLPHLDAAPVAMQHSPVFGSPRGWNHVNPPNKLGGNYLSNMQQPVAQSFDAYDSTGRFQKQVSHELIL